PAWHPPDRASGGWPSRPRMAERSTGEVPAPDGHWRASEIGIERMAPQQPVVNEEKRRLEEDRLGRRPWKKGGPYLSERQWGTVREDYSPHGTAWDYFPTTTPAAAPTAGAKTAWPASATTSSASAWRWPSGTAATQSSRSASSA